MAIRVSLLALALIVAGMTGCGDDSDGGGQATPTPGVADPTVEGPVTGSPFVAGTTLNLADVGYSQQEYFLSGTARSYTNTGRLDPDGFWGAALEGSAAYKTRILVYRPIDEAAFNGSVVVEWFNVSGGLDAAPDWISAHTELTREGYVWVGVSAQLRGVEGGGQSIPGIGDLSLKGFNPERYGSLSHPGDSFSYDIFSQVGQALRSPIGIDPLGGLVAEKLIAVGQSQSASRLATYVNAIEPLVGMYDGYLIHSRGGGSSPLSQSPESSVDTPDVVHIRTDLSVPVMTLQAETDMAGFLPARQPDASLLRLWEVAGTAHADVYTLFVGWGDLGDDPAVAELVVTAAPIPGIIECDRPINAGPMHFVLKAAIAALNGWIGGGNAPMSAPSLEIVGSPPEFVQDERGNVLGGVRTPYVDAPTAVLSGLGQTGGSFCSGFGTTVPFDAATLSELYPDQSAYVSAVNESTDRVVESGFLLPADAELIKAAAASTEIGS